MDFCQILGVNIVVTNMEETIKYLNNNISQLKGKYICVSNVHTTVTAFKNEIYRNVQNSAILCLPDGKPLSIVQKKRGYKAAERVTGPSLLIEMLHVSEHKLYRHVFYGSSENTLKKMKEQIKKDFPGVIDRCLFISPQYMKEAQIEKLEVINEINDFRPDFIWVGLGAPKQENWMYIHKGKLNGLSIGVGAAFDYLAGNIKRAPKWMQKCSLEWLYRLIQNPKLFSRYMNSNWSFIWNAIIRNK